MIKNVIGAMTLAFVVGCDHPKGDLVYCSAFAMSGYSINYREMNLTDFGDGFDHQQWGIDRCRNDISLDNCFVSLVSISKPKYLKFVPQRYTLIEKGDFYKVTIFGQDANVYYETQWDRMPERLLVKHHSSIPDINLHRC